jgi:hypothetical protein
MDLAAIAAVAAVIVKIYSFYQAAVNLMGGGGPDVDSEILDGVQEISQQLTSVQDSINTLQQAVAANTAAIELSAIDAAATAVGVAKGQAVTASEQYATWVQGGRTDAALLSTAQNNSQTAANTFATTPTFWIFPAANQSAGVAENVFDYRIALVQYVYSLTVRLTIIMSTEAGWATNPTILAELGTHAQWLGNVVDRMQAAITPNKGTGVLTEGSSCYFWVETSDTVSGLSTDPYQSELFTSTQDAQALLSFMETDQFTEVRNQIGLTTVMLFQSLLTWYAAGSPIADTWTPWQAVAPSIGPDASLNLAIGSVFPLIACSSEPSGLSLFWVAPDYSINCTQMSPGGNWSQPTVVMPAGTAGALSEGSNPLSSTVVQAVSSQTGSTVLVRTTSDGAIQSSFYDTRATNPTWAKPFDVAQPPAPSDLGVITAPNGLLATVCTGPSEISVFWCSAGGAEGPYAALMTSSFQLSVEQSGGTSTVVASAPTPPVQVVDQWLQSMGFAVVSGGPGSVSAFWFSESGLMSSYCDQREIVLPPRPGGVWSTPLQITPAPNPTWAGLAAVGSAPYTVDVFWHGADSNEPQDSNILTSSYSIEREVVSVPGGLGGEKEDRVFATTPTAPAQVVPAGLAGDQSLQIAAVTYGESLPGAAWVFWMTESQAIQGTYRASASDVWAPPVMLGSPLGEISSPIIAVSPAPSDVAVFMHAPDGTIVESSRKILGPGRPPGLTVFSNQLMMAWKGVEGDDSLWYTTFNGSSWAPQQQIPNVWSSVGPSLAVFNGKLYMAWKGVVGDQSLWWTTFDGTNWAPQQQIPNVWSSVGPSLAVFNGKLYMAWKGVAGDQGIWWTTYDGNSWAPQQNVAGVGTSDMPSLAVYNAQLYMVWKGLLGDQSLWYSTFNGSGWAAQAPIPGVWSSVGPALCAFDNDLYPTWKGVDGDESIWFTSFNGTQWAAQQVVPGVFTSPDLLD